MVTNIDKALTDILQIVHREEDALRKLIAGHSSYDMLQWYEHDLKWLVSLECAIADFKQGAN
jgi:hypothetical protein